MELVWNGKTREVSTAILPFQTLEHIDEPRREKAGADEQMGLEVGGRQLQGWTNKPIWGDNKLILSSLKSGALRRQIEDASGLKLIYIDPPFDVGADFSMDIEIGGETFHKEPNILEQIAYRSTRPTGPLPVSGRRIWPRRKSSSAMARRTPPPTLHEEARSRARVPEDREVHGPDPAVDGGSLGSFRHYFAQREAVETVVWLYEVRKALDKYDLIPRPRGSWHGTIARA